MDNEQIVKEILETRLTVKELLEYAKRYDGNGNDTYYESEYEGATVIMEFIDEIINTYNIQNDEDYQYIRNKIKEYIPYY